MPSCGPYCKPEYEHQALSKAHFCPKCSKPEVDEYKFIHVLCCTDRGISQNPDVPVERSLLCIECHEQSNEQSKNKSNDLVTEFVEELGFKLSVIHLKEDNHLLQALCKCETIKRLSCVFKQSSIKKKAFNEGKFSSIWIQCYQCPSFIHAECWLQQNNRFSFSEKDVTFPACSKSCALNGTRKVQKILLSASAATDKDNSKKDTVKWESDNGNSPSSIDLLLLWLSEDDNYGKYRGAGLAGEYKTFSKDILVKDFMENVLQKHGIFHRTASSIKNKISVLETQYRFACDESTRTGEGIGGSVHGEEFDIGTACPYYDILNQFMDGRPSTNAQFIKDSLQQDLDSQGDNDYLFQDNFMKDDDSEYEYNTDTTQSTLRSIRSNKNTKTPSKKDKEKGDGTTPKIRNTNSSEVKRPILTLSEANAEAKKKGKYSSHAEDFTQLLIMKNEDKKELLLKDIELKEKMHTYQIDMDNARKERELTIQENANTLAQNTYGLELKKFSLVESQTLLEQAERKAKHNMNILLLRKQAKETGVSEDDLDKAFPFYP
jgi:hypothetical protein